MPSVSPVASGRGIDTLGPCAGGSPAEACSPAAPCALPSEVTKLTSEMDHHLIINVADYGGGESKRFHERLGKFLAKGHPVKARNASRPAAHVPLITAPTRSAA